jgi:hypothetical protein
MIGMPVNTFTWTIIPPEGMRGFEAEFFRDPDYRHCLILKPRTKSGVFGPAALQGIHTHDHKGSEKVVELSLCLREE